MMRDFSPKAFCEDRIARRIGPGLPQGQARSQGRSGLGWDAFQKAADDASAKEKAKCASLPTEMKTPPSFPDPPDRQEEMMKSRLESIQAVKPTLMALYDKLSPEQKASVRPADDGITTMAARPTSPR
jgi:hypothetical protein